MFNQLFQFTVDFQLEVDHIEYRENCNKNLYYLICIVECALSNPHSLLQELLDLLAKEPIKFWLVRRKINIL